MSKENTATNLTDTAVVTELQVSNKKLREKLRQRDVDDGFVRRSIDDILLVRLDDLRNLLTIIPSLKNCNVQASVVNAMHTVLDEIEEDIGLIYENNIDELIVRYHDDKDKLLRGGEVL